MLVASATFGALLGRFRYRGTVRQWIVAPVLGYALAATIHGLFNGLNLVGIDVAGLYQAHRVNPYITIPQFVARMSPYSTGGKSSAMLWPGTSPSIKAQRGISVT